MITIYCKNTSARLDYTTSVLFDRYNCPFNLTDSKEQYELSAGLKINYSKEDLPGIQIIPNDLLFEEDIHEVKVVLGSWKNTPTLFANESKAIPFDLFSAIFYLLSRYEEYLPHKKDQHGRYKATNSIAFKNGFLEIPIVDIWMEKFIEVLQSEDSNLNESGPKYNYLSTIDVDSAFAYRGKGLYRTIGGFAKDVLKGRWKNFGQRLSTILGFQRDPFDTYDAFQSLHDENKIKSRYFFLLADYGPKDINLPHWSPRYRRLIRRVIEKNDIGIHPGYVSNFYPNKLKSEVHRLKHISNEEIIHSRQHYLILNWPDTYKELINAGITEDYTMGYADQLGFRAGTSIAYPFFDLMENKQKALQIHPFAVMDATLALYLNLSPEEAIVRIDKIKKSIQDVNGTFITCWHNESLSETIHWKGWSKVYTHLAENAKK